MIYKVILINIRIYIYWIMGDYHVLQLNINKLEHMHVITE
jgi:hypothetical protein